MNRKASPYYLNGEKFVILSEIPVAQLDRFTEWTTHSTATPSQQQGIELVKYDDYEYWFELYYLAEQDIDQLL
jgi:hypothetical protein